MINSRNLDDLHPKVADMARALIARCQAKGIDLLVPAPTGMRRRRLRSMLKGESSRERSSPMPTG